MVSRPNFSNIAVLLVAFVICAHPVWAQQPLLGDGPIVITAETLIADKKTNTAEFKGSVVAQSEDMILKSDTMSVAYGDDGRVSEIHAVGSVKLLRGDHVVTAGKAVFKAIERKIVFTDSPRAVDGGNVITGTMMTYLVDEDRFVVQGSRVLLEPEKPEGAENGDN